MLYCAIVGQSPIFRVSAIGKVNGGMRHFLTKVQLISRSCSCTVTNCCAARIFQIPGGGLVEREELLDYGVFVFDAGRLGQEQ